MVLRLAFYSQCPIGVISDLVIKSLGKKKPGVYIKLYSVILIHHTCTHVSVCAGVCVCAKLF